MTRTRGGLAACVRQVGRQATEVPDAAGGGLRPLRVGLVQASVHVFDDQTGEGSVLLDDGRRLGFDGDVFRGSALRHLRVGQRISVDVDGSAVTRLWLVGIGDDQPIR